MAVSISRVNAFARAALWMVMVAIPSSTVSATAPFGVVFNGSGSEQGSGADQGADQKDRSDDDHRQAPPH